MATTTLEDRPTKRAQRLFVLDTDIHESQTSFDQLKPYLSPAWRRYVGECAKAFGPMVPAAFPYASPPKRVRRDWIKPGERPGASLDTMPEFLFDLDGVSLGIVCGVYHPSGAAGNFEL
jgi:hypothetical protein